MRPGGDKTVKLGLFLPHELLSSLYRFGGGELFFSLFAGTPQDPPKNSHAPFVRQFGKDSKAPASVWQSFFNCRSTKLIGAKITTRSWPSMSGAVRLVF